MKELFENIKENKIIIGFFIFGLIVGGAIYLGFQKEPQKTEIFEREPSLSGQEDLCHIYFNQAQDYVGKFCIVEGRVDHVYLSKKGNIFLNFCKNYKTCPFVGVIFHNHAYKFPNPYQYAKKEVKIKGLIKTYYGRPEIIISDPSQIEIK